MVWNPCFEKLQIEVQEFKDVKYPRTSYLENPKRQPLLSLAQ